MRLLRACRDAAPCCDRTLAVRALRETRCGKRKLLRSAGVTPQRDSRQWQQAGQRGTAPCRVQQPLFLSERNKATCLLEPEELDDGQRHGGVEAQAALVRAQRAVELHPVPAVHLRIATRFRPGDDGLKSPSDWRFCRKQFLTAVPSVPRVPTSTTMILAAWRPLHL